MNPDPNSLTLEKYRDRRVYRGLGWEHSSPDSRSLKGKESIEDFLVDKLKLPINVPDPYFEEGSDCF